MPKNYGIGFVSEHPELSSKQLAEILGVTTRTIRNYKKTIRSSGAEIKSTAEREVMRNRQDRALR